MAIAVAVAFEGLARPTSWPMRRTLLISQKKNWVFNCSSFSSQTSSSTSSRKLILYSKPGCCLCDGLKEKLQAAFSLSAPDSLHDVVLQIRDITTSPEWEMAYQYEIPVLARVLSDGTEVNDKVFKCPLHLKLFSTRTLKQKVEIQWLAP